MIMQLVEISDTSQTNWISSESTNSNDPTEIRTLSCRTSNGLYASDYILSTTSEVLLQSPEFSFIVKQETRAINPSTNERVSFGE